MKEGEKRLKQVVEKVLSKASAPASIFPMLLISYLLTLTLHAAAAPEPIQMAITVDDLPSHGSRPNGVTQLDIVTKMLSVFKQHKVPEVYGFINAERVKSQPELEKVLQKWRAEGYPLGNHTFTHLDLNQTDVPAYEKEIEANEPYLQKLSSGSDWHYFRYPFLHEGDDLKKRNAIREFLKQKNYHIAQVTVDFEDYAWNDPYYRCKQSGHEKEIPELRKSYIGDAVQNLRTGVKLSQALFKRQIAHVLLLHMGAFDAEMVDELLTTYEKEGVKFIPLSQALKDTVYKTDPGLEQKFGAELPYQILKSRNIKLVSLGITPVESSLKKLKTICPELKSTQN